MARNVYFSEQVRSEQNLYEDIIIESLKIYGQDVYYLPRDIVNENKIFGDDIPSRFNSSHIIEMYIENIEGFDGEGDLFTRFGVEIRDEATFVVSKRRWITSVKKYDNEIDSTQMRPYEGDLIYLPISNKLFQINHVEHEQPFYQLNNLPVFKLRCQLFEYSDEDLDTGIDEIDEIETDYAYTYVLTLGEEGVVKLIKKGEIVTQILDSANDIVITGEVSKFTDSDVSIGTPLVPSTSDDKGGQLHLVHVGANDGLYHTFSTSRIITIAKSTGDPTRLADSNFPVVAVAEDNKISANEQNEDFQDFAGDFLDFSEPNPFGDPQ